jgi:flagellar hook-associated protein 2
MTTSSITPTAGSTTQPVVSVAGNGSAAAAGGSVIDVSQLVSELVAAAQAPQESLIANQTTAVTSEISALGQLKSSLSSFQSALASLATPSAFGTLAAQSSDQTAFTATADSSAPTGTYSVSVSELAQAEQLLSGAFAGDGTAAVGTGTLSISLGGTSFDVTIGSGSDTLDDIAQAINTAAGNPGITATVLQGSGGAHLLLSSSLTGAANTIAVSETDGGGGLAALTYGAGNTTNYTVETAAQDASFSVAGVANTSASNTVTDALNGVTLDLLGTTSSPATLTVATDTSSVQTNIDGFVTAYNTLLQSLNQLGGFDATTGTAGPMMGNGLLLDVQSQMNEALYNLVNTGSSVYTSLASVGITTNGDGTLSVNDSTLGNALATNFSAVSALFSGTGGIASTLNTQITAALASNGPISDESQNLTNQENALTTQSNQLTTQMAALSASLTQQYAALNTLLSSLQTTSAYLSQAFATLPTVQGKPNA